jgi:hypothetical protein
MPQRTSLFKTPAPYVLAYLTCSLGIAIYLAVVGWRPERWYEWGLLALIAPGAWFAAQAVGEVFFEAAKWLLERIPGVGHAMRSEARWAPWIRVPVLVLIFAALLALALVYGQPPTR